MSQKERLLLLAEDELTKYSTDGRKVQKLRQKINLSLSRSQQQQVKAELLAEMPTDPISKLVENQRQAVALPFWGIAGLGMLLGISMYQPLDILPTVGGVVGAIAVQKWGWKLQAKRLVLQTLDEIEDRMNNPDRAPDPGGR
jgi:hypothetical protein